MYIYIYVYYTKLGPLGPGPSTSSSKRSGDSAGDAAPCEPNEEATSHKRTRYKCRVAPSYFRLSYSIQIFVNLLMVKANTKHKCYLRVVPMGNKLQSIVYYLRLVPYYFS